MSSDRAPCTMVVIGHQTYPIQNPDKINKQASSWSRWLLKIHHDRSSSNDWKEICDFKPGLTLRSLGFGKQNQ